VPEPSPPPLRHYLEVVKRQAWLIAGVTLIAVATAAVASMYAQERIYRASMKVVVGQGGGVFEPQYGSQVQPFTLTMTNLLESDIVASTVIDNLQLKGTPRQLLANLNVTSRTESSVLELSYDSPNSDQAVAILSEIGSVFARLVDQRLGSGVESTRPGQDAPLPITASVFDPAHLQPGVVSPRPKRTIMVSAVLGLIIGILLAFARDALDDRVRGRRSAEEWFGAPVIGTLPKNLGRRPFGLRGAPPPNDDAVPEALYRLRANLQFSQGGISGPVLVITSALVDDTSGVVAANVGVTLAMAGYDVICVEADLRYPQLERSLDVASGPLGLLDVLEDNVSVDRVLVPVELGGPAASIEPVHAASVIRKPRGPRNGKAAPTRSSTIEGSDRAVQGSLRVLPVGRVPSNPADVFTRDRVVGLLEALRGRAEYIIISTPAVLTFGDAFPVLSLSDSVIVVARDGQTTRGVAHAVRTSLEGLGVRRFSVVLTDTAVETYSGSHRDNRSEVAVDPDRGAEPSPRQTV
jgi:succinoglycan biosynthesis transport protein ExoP